MFIWTSLVGTWKIFLTHKKKNSVWLSFYQIRYKLLWIKIYITWLDNTSFFSVFYVRENRYFPNPTRTTNNEQPKKKIVSNLIGKCTLSILWNIISKHYNTHILIANEQTFISGMIGDMENVIFLSLFS